jgi:hypothetical protein
LAISRLPAVKVNALGFARHFVVVSLDKMDRLAVQALAIGRVILANTIQGWNYIDSATFRGFTGANSTEHLLAICTINENNEGSCPTLQARHSEKRRVLRYPSSGLVSCPQLLPLPNSNSKNPS